jgi:hypothetical protein
VRCWRTPMPRHRCEGLLLGSIPPDRRAGSPTRGSTREGRLG